MKLSKEQVARIETAVDYCDQEEKSTEFMLQFAMDIAGCDYEDVVDYLAKREGGEK